MPPRPFPSQLRVGTDICEIARFENILRSSTGDSLHKWGSKIFNGLEWPIFLSKAEQYQRDRYGSRSAAIAQWMAGRFAAKEAAIKAHTKRRLLRPHVSIVVPPVEPDGEYRGTIKPIVLISPPTRLVIMNTLTAEKRGLKDVASERNQAASSRALTEVPLRIRTLAQNLGFRIEEPLFLRQVMIKEEDKRLADVSISHDGEYATAVCLALDEEIEEVLEPLADFGDGDPLHEPQWGDRGFGEAVE
ncbi:hypothetical protein MMC26_003823 [Xylographa opegraphella]|nr:hypothetical protein [Xylographa opegraphella]